MEHLIKSYGHSVAVFLFYKQFFYFPGNLFYHEGCPKYVYTFKKFGGIRKNLCKP